MNVVDSSGWLEYFTDGVNADFFAPAIEDIQNLLVPTISLTEVFKKVYRDKNESEALSIVALMMQGTVVDLDASIAIIAAQISADEKLPLADSILLATSRHYHATLWTQIPIS